MGLPRKGEVKPQSPIQSLGYEEGGEDMPMRPFTQKDSIAFKSIFGVAPQEFTDVQLLQLSGGVAMLDIVKFDDFLQRKFDYVDDNVSIADFLEDKQFPEGTSLLVQRLCFSEGMQNRKQGGEDDKSID